MESRTGPAPGPSRPLKHFIPLESNPEVFTKLLHRLGVSTTLCFQDVYSINNPNLLAFVPRPAHALVLVCPEAYGKLFATEDATAVPYTGSGEHEPVVYFEQTIHNACGLYALLHAVCNGEARGRIEPGTTLAHLLQECIPLQPAERAAALENSKPLEDAYNSVASEGDTEAPDAEDEVEFHYFCFVKSHQNGHLYLLDGDRKRPIDLGGLGIEEDVLSNKCLDIVRGMMAQALIQGEFELQLDGSG
ncbi:ubiquitin carboxyl-terminal hydrolase, family 1 [Xylariomycetidae sp. FL0641]|nr:ubiquitin carboxyl-terminal hydrolase, family 1 [Xylariomycetidae sp. FL0641]